MKSSERLVYELHSQTHEFLHRVQSGLKIISDGLNAMQRPYASVSFGKDSLVMAHLLLSVAPALPMLYVNCGEWDEWPDTLRVKTEFISRFPCQLIELVGHSIVSAYIQAERIYIQDEEITSTARKAQHDYSSSLGKILDEEAKSRGFDGAFMGLRKEESNNRARLFAMRGPLYHSSTRDLWACHPLAWWTGRDVWAYIIKYNLPYNELYDLDPRGREKARNGAMFGTRSARHGRLVFLQRMYPEWFNRFAAEFPEVRCYV